ncbi:MAG TPA: hypothetical protein VG347_05115 [Verrucomicrobiae bacterium]|nr:hypothetical protein [Verrucomicrobiae bacterium]
MISEIHNLSGTGHAPDQNILPAVACGSVSGLASGLVLAQPSALIVPRGADDRQQLAGMAQPIADVRTYLENRKVAVPKWELEQPLFHRLPLDQRNTVRRLQAACFYVRDLATGKGKLKVQPACEKALLIYTEFKPLKTFRAKFDFWMDQQDWLCLVNRAKAGPLWQATKRGLSDAFLDYVAARMGDFKRDDSGEQAINSIHRQWATGRTHKGQAEVIPGYEAEWDKRMRSVLPDGWHVTNIRRQLKARAKFTKATKALRHHGIADARKFLAQVHATRTTLRFMEMVQFDDVRCDFRVIDTATGQICDLWLLVARDVATTMLLGFGMRPARARDDGSQEHLKLQDMKQLTAWMFETYGMPPWLMTLVLENGTATLDAAMRMALTEMLPGRVDFQMASMIGGKSSADYWEKAVGNSKAKAMLESLNRLMHMMTAHFPGQIGASYAKRPTEIADREKEAVAIWTNHRAEDRENLQYPVLTLAQARAGLFEVFRLQNQRTDHNCEGFDQIVEWHDSANDIWQASPPPSHDCTVRARNESPMERAAKLVQPVNEWTRVSPEVIAAFYEHTQRTRPVEDNGEIHLTHEGKKLRFTAPADQFKLAPGLKVLCYFHPDDPRFLTITDGRGGILGTWLRCGLVNDDESLKAAIKHSKHALNTAQARANELAAGERAELTAMRTHNAGFITVAQPKTDGSHQPISSPVANRLSAVKGEKAATKKRKETRAELERIANEALGN